MLMLVAGHLGQVGGSHPVRLKACLAKYQEAYTDPKTCAALSLYGTGVWNALDTACACRRLVAADQPGWKPVEALGMTMTRPSVPGQNPPFANVAIQIR